MMEIDISLFAGCGTSIEEATLAFKKLQRNKATVIGRKMFSTDSLYWTSHLQHKRMGGECRRLSGPPRCACFVLEDSTKIKWAA